MMTEPSRLLDRGATEAERVLLNSARADAPPTGAAQHLLVSLESLTTGSSSAGTATAAHAMKLGTWAKIGLIALAGVGSLGVGVLVHQVAGQRSLSDQPTSERVPMKREISVASAAEIAREGKSKTPEAASETSAPVQGLGTVPRHRDAMDESLGAEIRILDLARAAVEAHNPAAAQRALDSYARRFPQGHLDPEAAVLHLAVLVRQGNRVAAKDLAAQLLASASYRAYDYRIRSLLREIGD